MKYLPDVRFPLFLMFLLMLSNSVQAMSSQQNSCEMTLLVNDEIITVVAPEKSDKVHINLPSGNSVVNLRCSLTQQAVFSFDRDEFVVLGHFDNQKEASILASRMGARLSNLSIHIEDSENIKVSASVGHVVFDSAPDSINVMLKSADKSMYSAKKENKSSTSYTLS